MTSKAGSGQHCQSSASAGELYYAVAARKDAKDSASAGKLYRCQLSPLVPLLEVMSPVPPASSECPHHWGLVNLCTSVVFRATIILYMRAPGLLLRPGAQKN